MSIAPTPWIALGLLGLADSTEAADEGGRLGLGAGLGVVVASSPPGADRTLGFGTGALVHGSWAASERLDLELGWQGSAHRLQGRETEEGTVLDMLTLHGPTLSARGVIVPHGLRELAVGGGIGWSRLRGELDGLQAGGPSFVLLADLRRRVEPSAALGLRAFVQASSLRAPDGDDPSMLWTAGLAGTLELR